MRSKLLLICLAAILVSLVTILGQTTSSGAIGAPSDNSTMPNFGFDDQSQDEIKPPINYILLGPTSQSESTLPHVSTRFLGTSEQDKFKVTGDENWFLDVDINMPGWLYIYEYFPDVDILQGKWIAYKWQLTQSGIWRLGPFSPGENELEGQHIYRAWFYSEGQWAIEDIDTPQYNLVYWTYSKGQPVEQPTQQIIPQPIPINTKEATFLEQLQSFINKPLVLVLGPLVLIAIIMLGFYLFWRSTKYKRSQHSLTLNETEPAYPSTILSSDATTAKIVLPNGQEVQLTNNNKIIGRGDLARAFGLNELGLISRQHFGIKSEDGQFYIEDLDSTNGTKLNGTDIGGKGTVILNDNDTIEPAGAVCLKFYIL